MSSLLSKVGLQILGGLMLVALGAGLVWWGLSPRIDLQVQRADAAVTAAIDAQKLVALQAGVMAEQQRQIGAVDEIHKRMRLLEQAVSTNARAQSAAFEELRRNDQAVAEYLRGPVPADLGRLYERPATTAPGAYRSTSVLPAGGVSAPSSAGSAGQ
ncbi:hypothetical protein QO207_11865 [Pseudomonas sp. CAN2814]|uniref:hypothetical protein n=1 Tax=Pseudomonas sp. CAN1 TaxID=3046726 RepID=UPI0026481DB0|nr:hypothetical protein [Pseudomonas sp. CAN1]MDN6857284.1 hypothetical protein [Pseudomonas sp. CAN1]